MHRFLRTTTLSSLALALVFTPLIPATAAPAAEETGSRSAEQPVQVTPPETTDRVIVKYKDQPSSAQKEEIVEKAAGQAGVTEAGEATEANTTAAGSTVVELDGTVTVEDAQKLTEKIAADPAVEYAEPDRLISVAEVPGGSGDEQTASVAHHPYADSMWALNNLGAVPAWESATGKGVTIGIVDTGFANHPDLDSQTIGGYDFVSTTNLSNDGNGRDADGRDPGTYSKADQCWSGSPATNSSWHGTHVAGSAAAKLDNSGTVGIAPDATLLNARALGACGTGHISDMIDSIYWLAGATVPGVPVAPKRADVINMSLSMPGSCSAVMQKAIDFAHSRGIPVVVAGGNNNRPAINYAPGNCYRVTTVGAITADRTKASYSNYGAAVDIYAPGHHIISSGNESKTTPTQANTFYNYGTSMASPHVAATAALIKQKNPALSADQIKNVIMDSGDPFSIGKTMNTHDAVFITPAFKDIAYGAAFYREISWMRVSGISNGWVSGDSRVYQPRLPVTREAMAAFLYRMAGSPAYTAPATSPFKDVPTTHTFYKEISWMAAQGISGGWTTADGAKEYRPGVSVDRDVMAAFLYRMAGSPAHVPALVSPFSDVSATQAFYKEMSWMAETGISKGWTAADGSKEYRPRVSVDRDVMAAFLYRLSQQI